MWIHLGIFALLLAVFILWRIGWLPQDLADKKSWKTFFLIGFAGNVLGLLVTLKSMDVSLGELRLEKKAGSYEQTLILTIEGEEPRQVQVRVPQLLSEEGEEEGEEVVDEEEEKRKALLKKLGEYNAEREEDGYYYLPEQWQGKHLTWEKKRDHSGGLLGSLFLVTAIITLVLRRREKESEVEKRKEELLMDYPELIMRFTLLIQSGMTVRNVFAKIASDYQKKSRGNKRAAYEEILTTCHEMEAGVGELEAYYRFGERCAQVKYKTFATLLIQNLQKGSHQLVDMLEKESSQAWEERKRKARILGEEAATRLLFPMILMMVVVMAIVMVPAMFSFYGI